MIRKPNKYDKYGRVIAWVYVDDALLQELLVSGGFAKVKYIYGDYLYVDKLNGLQGSCEKTKSGYLEMIKVDIES
ncbi:thermonuclease family protein [Erysipelothrix sp. Poltava]|nr:thermonuclease family protein [Erysipelothrix sp. Poltava]